MVDSKMQITCERCKTPFPSKNALFRHLKASIGASTSCLKAEEVNEFMEKVVNREENFEKIAILYGYILSDFYLHRGIKGQTISDDEGWGLKDGDQAAQLLCEAAQEVSLGRNVDIDIFKVNRSYGIQSRSKDIQEYLRQDEYTGALSEVLCIRLPPLFHDKGESEDEEEANLRNATQKWVEAVNSTLLGKISQLCQNDCHKHLGKIKVFGRLTVSKKFNAEMDVSHRRIDYLIPAELLYGPKLEEEGHSLDQFFRNLKTFRRGQTVRQSNENGILTKLNRLKRLMQKFCTKFVRVEMSSDKERESPNENDVISSNWQQSDQEIDDIDEETPKNAKASTKVKAARRRYHNFTPKMMAHEYLSYRRVDRFFHRATVRANEFDKFDVLDIGANRLGSRPYIVLSLKGDLFLNGQSRAMIGLFIAIVLGYIDEDILECIFDEDYTNLVPAPVLPSFAQFSAEAWYNVWEGKMKLVLCPRICNDHYGGWNTPAITSQVHDFEEEMHSVIMRAWNSCEVEGAHNVNQQLQSCKIWINGYLEDWSVHANEELNYYRKWKEAKKIVRESNSKTMTIATALLPSLGSISDDVPTLYAKVLHYLQEINSSNLWPATTPKRQLVMVSTSEGNESYESLVLSHIKAQSNNPDRESAYSFREGEGGASGSFSIGAMPGSQCEQPKGNKMFPELMKAAFELEIALCPDREPSSTIAINRNAQFRPHVDVGAGAGQSRSLIVGLGTYIGGELMVEGKKHCIRYKPLEFNGWTERHWTLPFHGERYSLVWFTPKGCDGVRGIDLCN